MEDMQEKYMKDFEMSELRKEKEKPQQEPQKLRKEADLAAGGAAQTTLQKGAWTPANPPETGFAGQGRSAQ